MSQASEAVFGIELDRGQAHLVIRALAERPFRDVVDLIDKLNAWGQHVFAADAPRQTKPSEPLPVRYDELTAIVEALGALPYRDVYRLIGSLQQQMALLQGARSGRTPSNMVGQEYC